MSNLVKGYYINVNPEDLKIIDNNDLVDELIQVHRERENRKKAMMMTSESDGFEEFDDDGFSEGLTAEQLESLTSDQNMVGDMPAEMSLGDFGDIPDEDPQMMEEMETADMSDLSDMPVPPNVQKDIDQILDDAQTQANSIVADARAQAESILQEAREEGHSQGYEEGRQEGLEAGREEVEQSLADREAELNDRYERLIAGIEPQMVDTLTRIYEHVFNVSFKDDKDIILHLLQTSLSRIEPSGSLLVHISPDDYDMVQDAKAELIQNITSPDTNMELVEDPTLKENECIIETDGGIFDCSVGVELEELSRKIKLLSYDRR